MTPNDAIALYRTEKAKYLERQQTMIAAQRQKLVELTTSPSPRHGPPIHVGNGRTDPLRRKGALDKQYDPADKLWMSLQPYYGKGTT